MPALRRAGVPRLQRSTALAVALLVAGWLIFGGSPTRPGPAGSSQPAQPAAVPLLRAWPSAAIVDAPGTLPDGTPYTPWLYADPTTSVGVAPAPDGSAQRVVVRAGDRVRELVRVGQDRFPSFVGFTSSGDDVYWAESTASTSQPLQNRLWRASLRGDAGPVPLTTDTGDVVFFNSQYDLVVHGDRLYWAAAAPSKEPATEVRSVPVAGGPTTSTRMDGAYELSAWPWLQTATGTRQAGPQELRNLDTGRRVPVAKARAEVVDCSPTWCRSIVSVPSDGTTRYDTMRPDGSDRRRVGGADTSVAVGEVALLDRFEPVLQATGTAAFDSAKRLALYDLTTGRLVVVAADVGQVFGRQHMLWWSTGDPQHQTWHSLDLSTLTG